VTTTYQQWALANLRVEPGAMLTSADARRDYVAWVSDHYGMKREPIGKQRAAILGLDGSITRKGRRQDETVYHGVALDYPSAVEVSEALAALRELWRHGLISEQQARRVCAVKLGV
jgi:hypothetical protein